MPKEDKQGAQVEVLDVNVYEEAKKRIKHCLEMYDKVVVSFSGGKDSLACLELTREVYDEVGWEKLPVEFNFRDEELIPDDVIELVDKYMKDPRFKGNYYAVPTQSHQFIFGKHIPYTQWDEDREWIRPKPEYAITKLHPENKPIHQFDFNVLIYKDFKGSVCMLNGIRADESFVRYKSCMVKKGRFNWINGDAAPNVHFCKPLFDWSQNDIFRYFYDRKIPYSVIYDKQIASKIKLRVATPLHDQAFETLNKLDTIYPNFYQQLCDIFPMVKTHVKYWADVDKFAELNKYPKSFAGIVQYCKDTIIDKEELSVALDKLREAQISRENFKRQANRKEPCYGLPLLRIFRTMVAGTYLKGIQNSYEYSPAEIKYELEAIEEAANGIE